MMVLIVALYNFVFTFKIIKVTCNYTCFLRALLLVEQGFIDDRPVQPSQRPVHDLHYGHNGLLFQTTP